MELSFCQGSWSADIPIIMVHDLTNRVIHVTLITLKVISREHDLLSLNVVEITMVKLVTLSNLTFRAIEVGFTDKG